MKKAGSESIKVLSPKRGGRSKDDELPSSPTDLRRTSTRFTRAGRKTSKNRPTMPDAETEEDVLATWGITVAQEEQLLVTFRTEIEAVVGPLKPMYDYYYMRRFLRARQHDITRAKEMFLNHFKWRQENGIDTILDDFNFTERDAFLTLYPQGYHKTDKVGRPVYIQHLGSIDLKSLHEITTEERMVRYHIQEYERCVKYIFPACSKVAGRHIGQTLAIMDVKGVGLRHLTGEVKRVLGQITRIDQDNYPETLGKTLIINAPTLFKAVWAVVKPMLDVRTQDKIELCPSDYMKALTKWVDIENIPEYLGGKSKGSLIDDVGPWQDASIITEIDFEISRRETAMSADGVSPTATKLGTIFSSNWSGSVIGESDRKASPFESAAAEVPSTSAVGSTTQAQTSNTSTLIAGSKSNGVAASAAAADDEDDEFFDAMTVRWSTSSYGSADEGDIDIEDFISTPASIPSPTVGGQQGDVVGIPSQTMQIPILARIRALEERIPDAQKAIQRYIPPHATSPSAGIGHGTLLSRVTALEKAMDTLLQAQTTAMDDGDVVQPSACSRCCSVM